MKRTFWLQLIVISLFFTLLSGALSVLVFQRVAAKALAESRKNAYLFLANIVESAPYDQALKSYERFRADSQNTGRSIWILSENGQLLASNTNEAAPPDWQQIPKPQTRHALSAKVAGLSNFADLILVRLDKPEPTYLLVRPEKDTPNRAIANAEIAVFLASIFITSLAGLVMVFAYLRSTSIEARSVMQRLHAGDLAARFKIHKLDKIGNLKLDFNSMADEIERLVQRVQITESTRRDLLQELSHDLRTPLTSLKTAIETLAQLRERMSIEQQQEMLNLAQSELNYFMRLLEDLFFIADLAEPNYKKSLAVADLGALCNAELRARSLAQPHLEWQLHDQTDGHAQMQCDPHLIQRLLRNALDNAGKYARSRVTVQLALSDRRVTLSIADDGPGIDAESLQLFGKRRKHRYLQDAGQANLSLGLGSVIIGAITELHGGSLAISGQNGTTLTIRFPSTDLV